jgi:hypothetical protein
MRNTVLRPAIGNAIMLPSRNTQERGAVLRHALGTVARTPHWFPTSHTLITSNGSNLYALGIYWADYTGNDHPHFVDIVDYEGTLVASPDIDSWGITSQGDSRLVMLGVCGTPDHLYIAAGWYHTIVDTVVMWCYFDYVSIARFSWAGVYEDNMTIPLDSYKLPCFTSLQNILAPHSQQLLIIFSEQDPATQHHGYGEYARALFIGEDFSIGSDVILDIDASLYNGPSIIEADTGDFYSIYFHNGTLTQIKRFDSTGLLLGSLPTDFSPAIQFPWEALSFDGYNAIYPITIRNRRYSADLADSEQIYEVTGYGGTGIHLARDTWCSGYGKRAVLLDGQKAYFFR